jgi:hypothetical protein
MKKKIWLKILGVVGIISLLAGLGLLEVFPTFADGSPPTPTITTNAAIYTTKVGTVSAVFNGSYTVGNSKVLVWFEYGLTTSYGSKTTAVAKTVSGTFSATSLTNLTPGVTYDYRADLKYGSTTITGSNETAVVGDDGGSSGSGTGQIYMGITVANGDTLTINNDVLCIGEVTVGDGATLTINGNCEATSDISINGGYLNVYGDFKTMGSMDATEADNNSLIIQGSCYVAADMNMGGGFEISGDLYVGGAMQGLIINHSSAVNGKVTIGLNGNGGITINAPFSCGRLSTAPNSDINLTSSLYAGNVDCSGNINDTNATLTVNGDLKVAGDINAGGNDPYITVNGNCYIDGEMGAIQLGGGSSGALIIQGSLFVGVGDIVLAQGVSFQSGSVECAGNFNAAADGINISIDGSCSIAAAFSLGGGTSGSCAVKGTAYFYGGYTLASGASLTVGNMPTLNPVTTTAP